MSTCMIVQTMIDILKTSVYRRELNVKWVKVDWFALSLTKIKLCKCR